MIIKAGSIRLNFRVSAVFRQGPGNKFQAQSADTTGPHGGDARSRVNRAANQLQQAIWRGHPKSRHRNACLIAVCPVALFKCRNEND